MRIINKLFVIFFCLFLFGEINAEQDVISLFPMGNYNQKISHWINPSDPGYDKAILSSATQKQHLALFYDHYFGMMSPWDEGYIRQITQQNEENNLKNTEKEILAFFSNEGKSDNQIGYGENFRPYSERWIHKIANNINWDQLSQIIYSAERRGIAVDNLNARALPTADAHFYHYKIAGQGYPFDNLQESAVWAGTPVYILAETRDRAWMLVVTPEYIAWVESKGIARTDETFVNAWTTVARQHMAAITSTQTEIIDEEDKYLFTAYVGAVFPAHSAANVTEVMVPVVDSGHQAVIKMAKLPADKAQIMPVTATPHHFANLMKTLIERPYGWGGIYFYNDCSAEMKSLLTPFGIWLPRNSSQQVSIGKMEDVSPMSAAQRLDYLKSHGKPFLSLIYIGGHVVMYIGNYDNPNQPGTTMAMTYQNLWGLSPNPANRREVVGGSVLFPMLLQYPEDPELMSLAGKKYFQISYLDELPAAMLARQQPMNIRKLATSGLMQ
ncbi:SH3 domain-containing protein [Legionella dresdenensis]|uniref:SH3 domain-containing protein n=1 Tax=Legionella dresdenensis TaxID=450200 RepID=A0ABV8CCA7_9GAMM